MKKLALLFCVLLSMTLTSCSFFDSKPINPQIIGSGNLQYDSGNGLWSVVIDSVRYSVATVTMKDGNSLSPKVTREITPVDNMYVTIFTSEQLTGLQAVGGKQSAEQIEALYHTNSTVVIILFGLMGLCIILLIVPSKQRVRVIDADA